MDSPESTRSSSKRNAEDGLDIKSDKAGDDEEYEGNNKRKHRSSKSKKPSNGEDTEGLGSSKRKSSGDRIDSRKRSTGSSRAGSDEDGYDTRKELSSKQIKKKQEESTLEKLSSWYQDGELDNRQDGEKSGNKGFGRGDDNERRKIGSKLSERESSQSRSKSKEERAHGEELEKTLDRDSKYSEKRESSRETAHGSSEQSRSNRRRWDETDAVKKTDVRKESSKERNVSSRNETKALDSNGEKGNKTKSREELRVDAEKSKVKHGSKMLEEDTRSSPVTREDRSGRDKIEKHRQQKTISRDVIDNRDKSLTADDDTNSWTRDKGTRDAGNTNKSRSPEKSGEHQESELSDVDYERTYTLKQKESEKDSYRDDDRSKIRDDSWSGGSRDREGSKDNWKRRQPSSNEEDAKLGDTIYDHGKEWEFPRQNRERSEHERPHGRFNNRKDGSRGEAVKTSSKYGISNENYDVIEIQTKPLDYGRAESGSNVSRRTEVSHPLEEKSAPNDGEWTSQQEGRTRRADTYGPGPSGEDSRDRYSNDFMVNRDQSSWRDDFDFHGGKGRCQRGANTGYSTGSQSSSGGSQPVYGNQDPESFNRAGQQGVKGSRVGRGGRGRSMGRDSQQVGIPLPIMGSPFVPLGMPQPGPMQPLTPGISPAPGPPVSPGVFIPPFSPPVWAGARGVDMSMLAGAPGLTPVPAVSSTSRFPPNIGASNPSIYFNQGGPGRGVPSSLSGPGLNAGGPTGRGIQPDKASGGWVPQKSGGPPGKAPSRGEQNDYSQNYVDTGMRPQNFIRELELTNVVEDYPKLRELIQKKDEIVAKSASPPMYYKCDLKEFELSPEFFGTKFDVILVDPPWEEYVHRAPGVADHMDYWTFEEIMNLKIEAIADMPSFIFLWVGDGVGLEQGRQCLKKWGFRRCEDICWVKTNKANATPGLRHDSHTLFQHSKEHCLMGIKGTVRRSTDGHIIHANIDTDVIIAEEPPYGSTQKPEDMYRIIEHFALGRRRLELFGEDHNIRSGWLTVGKELSSSNFNSEKTWGSFMKCLLNLDRLGLYEEFGDKEGKVWQGGGGRNPPPEAPHLVVTTPEIEALRPKSPMKNQQHQSSSISLTANSSNRRLPGNEASSSNPSTPATWGSPMEGFKGREGHVMNLDDKVFDVYGFSGQGNVDFVDLEAHRQMNLL